MKFYKILITLLVAALVIGFFYFLTLLSPSAVPEAPVGYVDPTKESAEILKESEALEAKFEKPPPRAQFPPPTWKICARRFAFRKCI